MVDMKEASVVLKEGVEKTWSGENLVCKIPVKKEYPRITAKVLAELSDKLGSFTTYYEKYDVDRCHNIENGTGFYLMYLKAKISYEHDVQQFPPGGGLCAGELRGHPRNPAGERT